MKYGEVSPFVVGLGHNSDVLKTFICPAATLVIDTVGARVHSFKVGGTEILYASPHESNDPHAGIPICAPWFGSGQVGATHPSNHGIVKWVDWSIVDEHVDQAIDLVLVPDHHQIASHEGYAGYEGLTYRLRVHASESLSLSLEITADRPTVVDAAFHPYFRASLPAAVTISPALERDYVRNTEKEFSGKRQVSGAHDSVFLGGAVTPIEIDTGCQQLTIVSNQPDVVVWNPGTDDPRFSGDEYRHFVCVETGAVQDHAVTLGAGETWTLEMTLMLGGTDTRR